MNGDGTTLPISRMFTSRVVMYGGFALALAAAIVWLITDWAAVVYLGRFGSFNILFLLGLAIGGVGWFWNERNTGNSWAEILAKFGPALGLLIVWLLFAVLAGENFTRWGNQRLMLEQMTVVGIAAVGATLIIVSGGIDLSVGSMIALGTMVVALIVDRVVESGFLAALGGIGVGALCGLAIGAMVIGHVGRVAAISTGTVITVVYWNNGGIVPGMLVLAAILAVNEKFIGRVPLAPFIVTLGMWGALRGIAKGLGSNQPIYPEYAGDPTWLNGLLQPRASGILSKLAPGVWMLFALALVMILVLRYTRFGRHVFAIGSNELTARLCGIKVEQVKLLIYAVAVGCAGLAAVMQFSFLGGMGDPTTAQGYELRVIAAVVIGGASLSGGEGSIIGTLIGALIMTVIDNGCAKLLLDNWVQEIVTGCIIVAAVALDRLRHRTG